MKHIITGGNGFLGTELAKRLMARGEKVLILDMQKTEDSPIYPEAEFIHLDVRSKKGWDLINIEKDDVIYHFAAKLLMPILPRKERTEFFWSHLYDGTKVMLEHLETKTECRKIIYYTTDMVYGHTVHHPRFEDHPREPVGPYGEAKYKSEFLCEDYRARGFNITIFRPRLIIGEGRLGILESLFKLIDKNLPVPMIGNGKNFYQFVSVGDCADSCIKAWEKGVPNEAYHVGSVNPPTVRELLGELIKVADSRSFLLPTYAPAVKFTLDIFDRAGFPIMDPEQYLIADETCVLDVSKAKNELGWEPTESDIEMLNEAYRSYRAKLKLEEAIPARESQFA